MVGTGARTQIKHATQQTRNTQGFTVKLFLIYANGTIYRAQLF